MSRDLAAPAATRTPPAYFRTKNLYSKPCRGRGALRRAVESFLQGVLSHYEPATAPRAPEPGAPGMAIPDCELSETSSIDFPS